MTLEEAQALVEELRHISDGPRSYAPALVVLAAEVHRLRAETLSYQRRLKNQAGIIRALQEDLDALA
jgi:hypothetical protein